MKKISRKIQIYEDGSDVIDRYERLLAAKSFHVSKIGDDALSGCRRDDSVSFLIARYTEDIRTLVPPHYDMPVLFILPDPPPEEEPSGEYICGILDESSSDWVILNTVKRVLKDLESQRGKGTSEERASRLAEETYKELLDGMNESVWVIDFQGHIIDVNKIAEKMLGYSRRELFSKGLPGIDGKLNQGDISRSIVSLQEDKIQVFETTHISKDGREIPVEISSSIIRYHGEPAILSIARDIHERKDAERQLREQLEKDELVVKAMHHRIKNNLATVANLLSLQARISGKGEVQSVLNEAVSRVRCIGLLYNKLLETSGYEGISVETYFSGIISSLLDIYPEMGKLVISLNMENIVLEEKYLFPLGVIVEELFTNIFKYGYPGDARGQVVFTGRKEGNQIVFLLKDDGHPMENRGDGQDQKGFGMMIVNLLCKQIKGDYRQSSEGGNFREIRFIPL